MSKRKDWLWMVVRIALVLVAVLPLAGCGAKAAPVAAPLSAVPAGAHAGALTGIKECEYQPTDGKAKYAAECGTLVVPENREVAGSRLIALPVVHISASGPDPAEPVFYLQGGPGQSNLSWSPPAWLLEKHDVVFVGYRGIDGTVTLVCPEFGRTLEGHLGKDLLGAQARAEYAAAIKLCAATYQAAGVDLSGYTIPGVVADIEAARTALGYDRINLLSESYGTRVAQIYAYMHPDSLHRLVLIGVNTPGHFINDPASIDKLIGHFSTLCTENVTCSSRTRDLAQTIYAVNHNMPQRWMFFNIDPDTVRLGAHFMFMSNPDMPQVLDAYLAAAAGDPSGLAMANWIMTRVPLGQMLVYGDELSIGVSTDLEKYRGLESVSLGNSIMGAPLAEMLWPVATAWPVALIPKELREFQNSDVEMLLVNGTVDFSTPPTALEEAKPYFHKAQMVLLPEFSHIGDVMTLQPKAFERMITSYYATGVADTSLFVYQPLSFTPGISLMVMAKALVAAMFVLPAMIILGGVLVVRRMRKRRIVTRQMVTT